MKKIIDFSERSIELIKYIQSQTGHKTFSAAVHDCISGFYHLQYFNKRYMNESGGKGRIESEEGGEEKMTDEQYCEMKSGKVNIKKQSCEIHCGSVVYSVPMTDRKNIDKIFNESMQMKVVKKPIRYE